MLVESRATAIAAFICRSRRMNERALLQRLGRGPVSGDALARETGQTRAAIWKRVEQLREAGVRIEAQPGRGYRLTHAVDLLDADTIVAALAPHVRSRINDLEIAWSIDSTNSELLGRPTSETGFDLLLAERQTGGRGRRGRAWRSPLAANVYLSLARTFSGGLARLGGLSLVAGVAVVEALRGLGYDEVGLKWPNDLWARERKLGGLLVEGGGEHGGPVRAVVGLGLNVCMAAEQGQAIDQPWTDLAALQAGMPSRNAVASGVLGALLPALDLFDREGLQAFVDRYDAVDVLLGREVVVSTGESKVDAISGIASGIAADGALRLRKDGAIRLFHAGDVSVRPG